MGVGDVVNSENDPHSVAARVVPAVIRAYGEASQIAERYPSPDTMRAIAGY